MGSKAGGKGVQLSFFQKHPRMTQRIFISPSRLRRVSGVVGDDLRFLDCETSGGHQGISGYLPNCVFLTEILLALVCGCAVGHSSTCNALRECERSQTIRWFATFFFLMQGNGMSTLNVAETFALPPERIVGSAPLVRT